MSVAVSQKRSKQLGLSFLMRNAFIDKYCMQADSFILPDMCFICDDIDCSKVSDLNSLGFILVFSKFNFWLALKLVE
jgi:hypothetical protein